MNGETTINIEHLGEVRKTPVSVLKVFVGEYRERTYIYCQVWDRGEQDIGPGEPTLRGLTMRPDTLRDLLPVFQAALKVAEARREGKRGRR